MSILKFADLNPNMFLISTPDKFKFPTFKFFTLFPSVYSVIFILSALLKSISKSACCQAWISKEDRLQKWNEQSRNEYWAKIVEAVDSTKGKIITYNEKPINAFFHANSGGATEAPVNVWGGSNYPYLQTVATSGEDAYTQYSSEVTVTKEEFKNKIIEKHAELSHISASPCFLSLLFILYIVYVLAATACAFNASISKLAGISLDTTPYKYSSIFISSTVFVFSCNNFIVPYCL